MGGRYLGIALIGAALGGAVAAEEHRAAGPAIFLAETCVQMGDAAFEHSLQDGLGEADRALLAEVFTTASYECLGLAMEICEGQADGLACLGGLAQWVREARAEVVARLPEALEGAAQEGYGEARAQAVSGPDVANCSEMTEAQRERYCDVVAEGITLEQAYHAWRLARSAGAMELEGHDPVDLEIIR